MESAYTREGAELALERWGKQYGEDLALRVYTSRLLGQDQSLVLHGGGNTSLKSRVTEITGDVTDVLYVKGSGWDLASIEPRGFPACRLARLRRACVRPSMTDEEMVAELRGQMIDPSSPTPSVEALLHAFLPAKFVDHTHADSVLAVIDQPGSEEIVRAVFGPLALWVPYVMPGFALARRVVALHREFVEREKREPELMILDKHGIFTWGETALESYERMMAAVSRAETRLCEATGPSSRRTLSSTSPELVEKIAPLVRGALTRASGMSWIVTFRSTPQIMSFVDSDYLATISQIGCATPDHVIRTKPTPMLLALNGPLEPQRVRAAAEAAILAYAERYHAYFQKSCEARDVTKQELDPYPRIILIPGVGMLAAGATRKDAEIAADVYEHTAGIIEAAGALTKYEPVGILDLFDVEYWSLEQAKLDKGVAPRPLDRKVALVTGAANGIGLATVRALLVAGAHVVMTDRDDKSLEDAAASLKIGAGGVAVTTGQVHCARCDVSSEREVRRAIALAIAHFGGLDMVVSNAGGAFQGALYTSAGDAALRSSLEVNLLGHQNVARAAAELMIAQGTGGALLFNASKSAFNQGPDFGPYAIAKAALVSLMRQYAIDLAPHGIRANAVNADRIRTNLFEGGVLAERAKARGVPVDEYFKANLLRRETTVADVAGAFIYLATAMATTGCVITVDGGNAAAFPR